jgi:hypothetical protein
VRVLDAQVFGLEAVRKERIQESKSFQSQARVFWQEINELALQAENDGNLHLSQLHELTTEKERLLCQLRFVQAERNALRIQNTELVNNFEDVYAACEEAHKEKDLAKRRFDADLEEKSKRLLVACSGSQMRLRVEARRS